MTLDDFFAIGVTVPLGSHVFDADSIKAFKQLVYQYNGTIHSPNYLQVVWGGLAFKCRLTSLNIDYTLFDSNGAPLRAKLTPSGNWA